MRSTVEKHVLDAGICKKLECVFDQGRIGKRQQTLYLSATILKISTDQTYPGLLESKRLESGLESIGQYLHH